VEEGAPVVEHTHEDLKGGLILVLGGARSGKSSFARRLVEDSGGTVLFVATGEALDEEMGWRIEEHKRERPKGWRTLELSYGVGQRLASELAGVDVVIVDCVTLLVSNILMGLVADKDLGAVPDVESGEAERCMKEEIDGLLRCIEEHTACFVVVSNEVGLGLVPDNRLGRVYRDLLGRANQMLAARARDVYFLVAGIPVKVKPEDPLC
jgi:adenosylcobinamide kinase/adenosylcobinamide-phosphate guanylyltransferase